MMRRIVKKTATKGLKVLIVCAIISSQSCGLLHKPNDADPIMARTELGVLTLSQVSAVVPNNIHGLDSVQFVQSYVDRWIHNQLLLENAMEYVDKETQRSVNQMVADYHTTLLVHKYKQMYIEEKLDTVIPDSKIEEHYSQYGNNFLLDSAAVRTVFVKVAPDFKEKNKLRRLVRSTNPDDAEPLAALCANALYFDNGTNWHYLSTITSMLPQNAMSNPMSMARNGRFFETQDDSTLYMLMFCEFRDVNEQAPLVFAKNKIREILINHRKNDLIKNLEIQVYIDAVNKQRFTNYVN